jgi:D-alanine-D-alanine ligase
VAQREATDTDKPPSQNLNKKNNGLDLPQKIGIVFSDVKREYFPTQIQYLTEKDAKRDAKIIASYLEKIGIKTNLYPANSLLPKKLKANRPEMVINLVGSVKGNEYLASTIPALLELLEIPYTGAGILGESLSYNKFLVKKLLEQNNVPVPRYQLFNTANDPLDPTLRFPLISKLNEIHGAVEITKDSVSENEKHLRERLKFLINTYEQAILVEEFIVGREITAFLFEGLNKKVYLAERIIKKKTGNYTFASFELQWLDPGKDTIIYHKYKDPLLQEYVKKAFEINRMADYGKFDIRLDYSGRYYFIDSNSNPAFGPKEADCPMSYILEIHGVSFIDILKRLLLNTMRDAKNKERLPIGKD